MREFKHWPLLIAATAIIATQLICAWWTTTTIDSIEPEAYGGALERIESEASKTAYNTAQTEMRAQAIEKMLSEESARQAQRDIIGRLTR